MADPSRSRQEWVDMGGIGRLVERVLRNPAAPPDEWWREPARPLLGRHWPLADHDWHRRRSWQEAGLARGETDHHFTRYALLPDGRLIRADQWRSETAGQEVPPPWQGEIRAITAKDVRTLDQPAIAVTTERGTTTTWGTRPTGPTHLPWAGAGLEGLLKALVA